MTALYFLDTLLIKSDCKDSYSVTKSIIDETDTLNILNTFFLLYYITIENCYFKM